MGPRCLCERVAPVLISICGLLLRNDLKLLSSNLEDINTSARNGIGRDSYPEEGRKVQSREGRRLSVWGPTRVRIYSRPPVSEGRVCSTMLFTWLLFDTHFLIDWVSSAGLVYNISELSGAQHFWTRLGEQLLVIKYVPVTGKDNYVLGV